ncbi:MAG: tRNA lysidine(34) synthetase TilS [Rhodospirillales bacterium]|nr:tRNA lysidine(34) synthetase TilS [Rhodospirillales bacterium]
MTSRFKGTAVLSGGGVAVGVSGGPDSMALCHLLAQWVSGENGLLHAFTVDHGLRPESEKEAWEVAERLSEWPGVTHHILRWDHEGEVVDTRIQEAARTARYDLMRELMRELGVTHLFLAHHRDDQAETVLFRLAHGSGLDGLCGMAARQVFAEDFVLCRPLLGYSKADLIATCEERGLFYHRDPSNEAEAYARARMRGSMEVLAHEGLTPERLSVTAGRLARAKAALDEIAEHTREKAVIENLSGRAVLSLEVLRSVPAEIGLRVLLAVMGELVPPDPYGPRLERVETLFADLMKPEAFRKRTLSKIVFERKDKTQSIILTLEARAGEKV